jgi:pimeloyl-ACP methyl ester carboxylesterase
MRPFTPGVLAFSLVFTLSSPFSGTAGYAAEPERVRFETADFVTIQGTYYASDKGKRAPCAILLHPIGENSQMEGWDDLAKTLQKKGIAVLTFDFRGHGDSTSVEDKFWYHPINRTLKSYKPGKLKAQISFKDFTTPRQYAMLVQDIAAARHFLDQRNDAGECNSSNLIVVGAESGAALGALWIWTEWQKPRFNTAVPGVTTKGRQVEGQDISCAVWLGITPNVGTGRLLVDGWLRPPVREKVPMLFLYGEGDKKGATYARHLYTETLRASDKDKQMQYTRMRDVKGAKQSGRDLLNKSLETLGLIEYYVDTVLADRGGNTYVKRDADRTSIEGRDPADRLRSCIPVDRYVY